MSGDDELTTPEVGDELTEPSGQSGDLRTGHEQVDAVLGSLDDLADRPVSEHVAIFERAHEQLRSALDAPADN